MPTGKPLRPRAPALARYATRYKPRYRRDGARHPPTARGIEAESHERLGNADAVIVLALEQIACRTCPQPRGFRAIDCETHAFLVDEADHLDGEGKAPPSRCMAADAGDGCQHPEHAVIFSGVAHGIEMRAEHAAPPTPALRAFVTADDIADRDPSRLHARLAHPREHEVARAPIGGRERGAGQIVGRFAERGEPIDPCQNLRAQAAQNRTPACRAHQSSRRHRAPAKICCLHFEQAISRPACQNRRERARQEQDRFAWKRAFSCEA